MLDLDVLHVDQVKAQVESANTGLKQGDTFHHLSIVKFADLETFKFQGTQVREWSGVLRDLGKAANQQPMRPELDSWFEWCRDTALFLERLGVGTFKGFGEILRPVAQVPSMVLRQFAWVDLKPLSNRRPGQP